MASPQFDPNWSRLPSGTEISELRSPTSHTYSNGDGTFTVDMTPMRMGGDESQDSCQPTSTGRIEYFDAGHGSWYKRGTPELAYMNSGIDDYVAYAKFELAQIPDSGTIMSAQFRCYQYQVFYPPVRTSCTYPSLDPDTADDPTVYSAVRNGLVLADGQFDSLGWIGYDLSDQGVAILQSRLPQDWATLGISPLSGGGLSYGIRGDDRQTYLHIVYNAAGTCEPRRATLRPPELVLTPNPATGRYVMARCDIAAGSYANLALRDVMGRTEKTFRLNPSGTTRLDLRGFAPGVYFAEIDIRGQLGSRKLVLTAP
jgi:hypothetical protein